MTIPLPGGKDAAELSPRESRAVTLLQNTERPIVKTSRNTWMVPSATAPALGYIVTRWGEGGKFYGQTRWQCTCPDFEARGVTCKHQFAVQFLLQIQTTPQTPPTLEAPTVERAAVVPAVPEEARPACKFCASEQVIKIGRKSGSQQYRCKSCTRKFVPATGFERISADPKVVCLALDLSFKGLSLRKVTDTLNQFYGLDVGKSTIHRWMDRYATLLNAHMETLHPEVGDKWHADEVFTKFSGKLQYVWHLMDAKTRFLLVSQVTTGRTTNDARNVFQSARDLAAKRPTEVVTDGLPAYAEAFNSAFNPARGPRVKHTREIHISKPQKFPHNNKVERLNATLRERQKVTRGLKAPAGPLTKGHRAYYNLIRPHQALDGKTPAEAAGLPSLAAAGKNRWASAIHAATASPTKTEGV